MIFELNKVVSYLPRSKHKSEFESLGEEWPYKLLQGQSVSRQLGPEKIKNCNYILTIHLK